MALEVLRIGTRGSPMAMVQSGLVRDRLLAAHPGIAVDLVPIRTTGDRVQNRLLAEIGGKGLFTKEIEEALLRREVDIAVHSLKDMETVVPPGLAIGCVLARDDPRDALVSSGGAGLAALPAGARIGTASLRRRAQLLRRRGDLRIAPIRGNVNTRLNKLAAGEAEALVLALSGLERLDMAGLASEILPTEMMLPAVGQGALAIECRADDARVRPLLSALHDPATAACVAAERAMLAALDGSCRTPIAGLATLAGDRLSLAGLLLAPDGQAERRGHIAGAIGDAAALGTALGNELRRDAGPEFGLA
ncbi:MAG TPA: hydroxymethylbilane synthase [Stellaceae bacterium]|nr:hydroxymethylbilane synthase [Stellaceae bacterium]